VFWSSWNSKNCKNLKNGKKKVWRLLDFQEGFGNQKNGKLVKLRTPELQEHKNSGMNLGWIW